jgi:hypothetical protein
MLIVSCFSKYGYTNNIKHKLYKYDKKGTFIDNISYKFISKNKTDRNICNN